MYDLKPQKKSNGCLVFFAVIGVIALGGGGLLFLLGIALVGGSSHASYSGSSNHSIVYKIHYSDTPNGCHYFDTTYEMPGGTAQNSVAACDRVTTVDTRTGMEGDFVYLSVQADKYSYPFSCQIFVDGKLYKSTESSGSYSIASCSGSVE